MYQRLFAWNAGKLGTGGHFLRSLLPYKYRPLLSKVLSRPLKVAGNQISGLDLPGMGVECYPDHHLTDRSSPNVK